MKDKNQIDSAEYISLEEAKRIRLPFYDGLAAGFPSPAMDYQHESLDLNEKFVNHPEASYFVRVRGESMIGLGILDGDICLVDRQEEIYNGNIVVAFVNGGLTVKTLDTSTKDKGYLRLMPANPDFEPIKIHPEDLFILQGKVTSIHRQIKKKKDMYAIIDCDNCFVSCERVFRPDLIGKPVCVLSNNDGCVVARSNEAKALGIKAGLPYYQLKERFPNDEVIVFSSNYELYGDITDRVMSLVRKAAPTFYRYSIDEGFCDLSGMEHYDLKKWGEDLSAFILKATRMPVSIGIASTKTLAKMASHYAKHYKGYKHCCMIGTEDQRIKALQQYEIEEVWGIGRRYAARLQGMGVKTAFDFANQDESWVRAYLNNVVAIRTWKELNGIDCIPMEEMSKKKSICTSRSFPGMVSDMETLRTSISNFAARCAEKLRKQESVAQTVSVFIDTNHFREDLPQYWNMSEERLLTPSNSTLQIVQTATRCMERIFRKGYSYKRAGVIVMGICPDSGIQTNFIDYNKERFEKLKRIDEVLDKINREYGSEKIVLASQQYTAKGGKGKAGVFKDSIKHDFRSPCYTTRWSDIPEAT